jgi:hypothetical protein
MEATFASEFLGDDSHGLLVLQATQTPGPMVELMETDG